MHSKHSLGSHEYVQNCRKWENEITLQLLSQSTMRRDLARTVSRSVTLTHELVLTYRSLFFSVSVLVNLDCLCAQAEDDKCPIDVEKHLGQVDRPFRENVTRYEKHDGLPKYSLLDSCIN